MACGSPAKIPPPQQEAGAAEEEKEERRKEDELNRRRHPNPEDLARPLGGGKCQVFHDEILLNELVKRSAAPWEQGDSQTLSWAARSPWRPHDQPSVAPRWRDTRCWVHRWRRLNIFKIGSTAGSGIPATATRATVGAACTALARKDLQASRGLCSPGGYTWADA